MTNNNNNYILTATGGNSVNGEGNLLFDGNDLVWEDGKIRFEGFNATYNQSCLMINGVTIVEDAIMQAPVPMMYDMVAQGVGIQSSSLRFKDNVETLEFNHENFLSLNARNFNWKETGKSVAVGSLCGLVW